MVRLRTAGRFAEARGLWRSFSDGREAELRARYDELIDAAYVEVCAALEHAEEVYVTFGNVDRPDLLAHHLPPRARFVDAEVVEIDGLAVGFAGGGITSIGTAGEVTEDEMADKLDRLGRIDVLCTHVPPSIDALATDVVGGRSKGSEAIVDYLDRARPGFHYFGDIHQGRATTWRHGATRCVNVGYFRATGRAIRHG
jgi:Icc-related predicted phosphoesterase